MFKRKKSIDKIITSIIIGSAIGSILGLTLAPRKGKELRKIIKKKGKQVIDAGKIIYDDHKEEITQAKEKSKGFFNFIRNLFKKTNK